jgi:hypothetical protein
VPEDSAPDSERKLRAIDGGLAEEHRRAKSGFDAEYQHEWCCYRPFHMHRVESFVSRAPKAARWGLRKLLDRVDDEGWWKGQRATMTAIFELSDSQFREHSAAMKREHLILCRWGHNGTGYVRILGWSSLLMNGESR